jgi:hypothetical protein
MYYYNWSRPSRLRLVYLYSSHYLLEYVLLCVLHDDVMNVPVCTVVRAVADEVKVSTDKH